MARNFRLGFPEMIGLGVVGATMGAVLCGAAVSELTVRAALGAIAGGAILPALVLFPWARVMRARPILHATKAADATPYRRT